VGFDVCSLPIKPGFAQIDLIAASIFAKVFIKYGDIITKIAKRVNLQLE
jgi:hypothetical protein